MYYSIYTILFMQIDKIMQKMTIIKLQKIPSKSLIQKTIRVKVKK